MISIMRTEYLKNGRNAKCEPHSQHLLIFVGYYKQKVNIIFLDVDDIKCLCIDKMFVHDIHPLR